MPRAAVLHDDQGDYLFQLDHGKAQAGRRVRCAARRAIRSASSGALDAKARVIVQGVYELDDGDAVRESAR